ncbi:MAG: GTPase Era [Candidatus Omnitrophica bacterium]|nr:GTPase Era [Candidatus Omnitrophota bacterium]
MKSGMVAIVGRPNVGKSTLLNYLAGEKVAIVSPVPQTTRHQIRAIINDVRGQVVFCDTPGLQTSRHALDRAMVGLINDSVEGADVILHIVDVSKHVGEEEEAAVQRLHRARAPVILGLNKVDLPAQYISEYVSLWERVLGRPVSGATDRLMPVPMSAIKGTNIDKLVEEIFARLPEGEALYPADVLTDFPRQLAVQDVIREKLLFLLREELPFSLAVLAEEIVDRSEKLTYVKATIFVERETQKAIAIGKNGAILKKAGESARKELQDIYGKKFFLDLWVKADKKWKEDRELLQRMGYLV